jgi:hypothetical protein
MTQHVDVSHGLTAIGEHHRHIGEHPAAIMTGDEGPPR